MTFSELPPLRRALVVLNALAVLPGAYVALVVSTWLLQTPSHSLVVTILKASPVLVLPLGFAYLTWASLRGRAKWFQTVFAVLSLPMVPFGTVYGVIALYVYWSRAERS